MARAPQSFLTKPFTMALLFVFFVIVPGIVLSLIGLRSLSRENAFLEKQVSSALTLELKPLVTTLADELDLMKRELDFIFEQSLAKREVDTAVLDSVLRTYSDLSLENIDKSLILFEFTLAKNGAITYPKFEGELTVVQQQFFRFNREFFQDRTAVPIYTNIVQNVNALPTKKQSKDAYKDKEDYFADKGSSSKLKRGSSRSSYTKELSYEIITKESLRFSQIIAEKPSGMILREIDGQLMLLYYHTSTDSSIRGAVVSLDQIVTRLTALLPQKGNPQRMIVVSDQNEQPLIRGESIEIPKGEPLVELSLGSYLPVWHLSAYLTDPLMIERKAQTNGLVIGLMIALLLVSLTIGGVVIIRSIVVQLRDAEQKTTFVANVSHELKTPLTSIRLFSELLQQERQPEPEKQKKYLSIMVSESERLTRLINNVLDFSRGSNGERQYHRRDVNITTLLGELIEHQRVRLEHKKFTVEVSLPNDSLHAYVDPESIKQVLLNLLSNAEKYSFGTKWISVRLVNADEQLIIHVEDRGIGIDASLRKKIFQEFYRVDTTLTTPVPGTGLGLTITERIIHDHGGTISCDAGAEGGTCFTITLPQITSENGEEHV